MEVLHLALDKAMEMGLIEGVQNVIPGMIFTHLQFANDTILFLRADEIEVNNAKYILRCFEIFSSLSINFNKSCLVGFDVKEETLYKTVAICKCKIGSLRFNYLRILLGENPRRISTWNLIVGRFRRKLSGWKSCTLSWATKVVLINAVLSSPSIYCMSLFQAPMTVIKNIDKIRRNFLWGVWKEKKKDGHD